ncbi:MULTISPECIES: hypothetical protein [Mesorhizobium]|uniref:Uncharacterized protein n=1 Tax=Rhizobium loti TaxID=381 RepID=A0A6M7U935_RHILI|nr:MULTISPECIES: hypothetical protein [Mesorhizobium]KRB32105.1 hypothetical protein ASE05_03575 [Mesorhizobium sp. Root172]OBQ71856.1 hypothetical protein A8145_03065 [Mesorhizobium loti]QKC72563.1 hypothetical protein EB815_27940 [Mesorhizobium loti]
MALGPGARTWLNRIGAFLGLAGLVFVGMRLHSYAGEIDFRRIGLGGYVAIAALAGLYGLSNLLLAVGWWRLLVHLGVSASRSWAIRAYATSQLAKYVPGNIFQFAGRQAIGVAAGIGNRPLAKSTAYELAILIVSGALFSPLLLSLIVADTPDWLGWVCFAAVVAGALWLASNRGVDFGVAAICYLAFLAFSGLVFAGAYNLAGGSVGPALYPAIAGAYVLAWLAGLVTPGAPAGIGVREAVLLFLLGEISPGPVIVLAAVIGRTITVLGDLFFFVSGHIARRLCQKSDE